MIPLFKDSSQKINNLKQLYSLIHKHGPITKGSLVELSGLKQSTCARLIEELLEEDAILESGLAESSGGRKPLTYQINPRLFYLIGIDISRIYSKILLMDLDLSVLGEARMSMRENSTPELTIDWIQAEVTRLLEKHQIPLSSVLGLGIGAVGPLNRETGMITNPSNFPSIGWRNVPICQILGDYFDRPVLLDNGANTAVLGEYRYGFWTEADSMVYNITGVGIRCGTLANGQVIRGPVDMEGAYGHMTVDIHGKKCTCGRYGCLNAYSTTLAIQEEVMQRLKRGHPSLLRNKGLDVEHIEFTEICAAVKEQDPLCCEVVHEAAYYYGIGLANMMVLLHPNLVVLGGALVTEMDYFYDVTTQTAKEKLGFYPDYPIHFSRGRLGENAIAVGAGSMVFESCLR
ncbi:ROK family protein [Ammoniphilus sp. YIM 78166]|uniref:ROK family protein n=1 Tax=Ammoniphilus sp. YIM 78166 TaxID=1644106 RepID=UPI00106F6F5E|nr:ROK family protein [Ammoniphilus sp. YIM 78166]